MKMRIPNDTKSEIRIPKSEIQPALLPSKKGNRAAEVRQHIHEPVSRGRERRRIRHAQQREPRVGAAPPLQIAITIVARIALAMEDERTPVGRPVGTLVLAGETG